MIVQFHSLKMYPFGLVSRQIPSISKHGSAMVLGVHHNAQTKERIRDRIWMNFMGQGNLGGALSGGSLPVHTPKRTTIEPVMAAPMIDQAIRLEASADSPVTDE